MADNDETTTEEIERPKPAKGRAHVATYARDKRNGGYIVRVQGPNANRFAGRTVPVTRRDRSETQEELDRLVWSGKDNESAEPVALYTFKQRPRDDVDADAPF